MIREKNKNGFTLIELMLVVIILGILVAAVVPRFAGRSEQARKETAKSDILGSLSVALDLFEVDNGRYPTTEQGIEALVTKPTAQPAAINWNGPYLKKKLPLDPWGRLYTYKCPGEHNPGFYDLFSLGSDGVESQDDITNWESDAQEQRQRAAE